MQSVNEMEDMIAYQVPIKPPMPTAPKERTLSAGDGNSDSRVVALLDEFKADLEYELRSNVGAEIKRCQANLEKQLRTYVHELFAHDHEQNQVMQSIQSWMVEMQSWKAEMQVWRRSRTEQELNKPLNLTREEIENWQHHLEEQLSSHTQAIALEKDRAHADIQQELAEVKLMLTEDRQKTQEPCMVVDHGHYQIKTPSFVKAPSDPGDPEGDPKLHDTQDNILKDDTKSTIAMMKSVKPKTVMRHFLRYMNTMEDVRPRLMQELHHGGEGRIVIPALRVCHVAALCIVITCMFTFAGWGVWKICHPKSYFEIHREEQSWLSGEMPLPEVAFQESPKLRVTVAQCSIQNGKRGTKVCTPHAPYLCNVTQRGGQVESMCLDPGLRVGGTWGDPMYKYVEMKLFPIYNASFAQNAVISVSWTQRLTLFSNLTMSRLYGFGVHRAHELFFLKYRDLEGGTLGFAGHHGNDESTNLLTSHEYLNFGSSYSRNALNDDGSMSIILRAELVLSENMYQFYSILELMDTLGGLWTAFSGALAGLLLFQLLLYKRIKEFFGFKSPETAMDSS